MDKKLIVFKKIKFEIDLEDAELLANEELHDYIRSGEPYKDFEDLNPENIQFIHFWDFGIEENDSYHVIARIGATVFFKDQLVNPSQFLGRISVGFRGMDTRSEPKCKVMDFYRYSFEYE